MWSDTLLIALVEFDRSEVSHRMCKAQQCDSKRSSARNACHGYPWWREFVAVLYVSTGTGRKRAKLMHVVTN